VFVSLIGVYGFISYLRHQDRSSTPTLLSVNHNIKNTTHKATEYTSFHEAGGGSKSDRVDNAQTMVNEYYDLSTDFYLFGWGESFHFATRHKGQGFPESLIEHEHYLASRLNVDRGMHLLDVGCGVGGPMRNICKFTGCRVTGLNNNEYQLTRVAAYNEKAGLSDLCTGVHGDFMNLPFAPNTFDGIYAIEATCHAPDRTACFRQIFNALKPGARFVTYEWVMTPKYNPEDKYHRQIKEGIELGNALPDITDAEAVRKSLSDAGFDVVEVRDLALDSEVTWYDPFEPRYTVAGFKTTPIGIKLTNLAVKTMEAVKLAPAGSALMHDNLSVGAVTLFEAGKTGIFTPMLLCVGQKPL